MRIIGVFVRMGPFLRPYSLTSGVSYAILAVLDNDSKTTNKGDLAFIHVSESYPQADFARSFSYTYNLPDSVTTDFQGSLDFFNSGISIRFPLD